MTEDTEPVWPKLDKPEPSRPEPNKPTCAAKQERVERVKTERNPDSYWARGNPNGYWAEIGTRIATRVTIGLILIGVLYACSGGHLYTY